MRTIRFVTLIFGIILSEFSLAQNIEFTATAPGAVEEGETFRLTFTLNAKGSNFQAPDLSAFRIYSGPNSSSSNSIQVVNGQMSQTVSYSFTYILGAQNEGIMQVGSAKIMVSGKEYQSAPIKIEVVKGTPKQQAQQQTQSKNQQQQDNIPQAEIADQELFVRINVDRKSVYQGEHIVATIKIYTRVDLANFIDMKFPAYNGFYTQDIEVPQQISLNRENVNGKVYEAGVIKKTILFPQRNGEITIEPFEITCAVRQRVRRSQSVFDDFFGTPFQTLQKKLISPAVKVYVKQLPENKPDGFTGAVGNFKISASIDKQQVNTNDAITLKVKISGNGNLKLIEPLKFDFPADFEVYDPKTDASINNNASGSSGIKTFDYLIIPRHAGQFEIPSVPFAFFNPETEKFVNLFTPSFQINVNRGTEDQSSAVISSYSKEDVKLIGTDIRYIKISALRLTPRNSYIVSNPYFWLSYPAFLVVFVIILLLRREQIRNNANIARVKNRGAAKLSRKRLKFAHSLLLKNQRDKFYEEIQKALWGYLSDKLAIPLAELTKDRVAEALHENNVTNEMVNSVMGLIDKAEFARYAPVKGNSDMEEIYNESYNMIISLDQNIRKF